MAGRPRNFDGVCTSFASRLPQWRPMLSKLNDSLNCVGANFESALNVVRADLVQTYERSQHFRMQERGKAGRIAIRRKRSKRNEVPLSLASLSLSSPPGSDQKEAGDDAKNSKPRTANSPREGWLAQVGQARAFYKQISVMERAKIGAVAGGLAGAFTYCCLHPIDTVRTKLQTRGAAVVYKNGFDVVVSILKTKGILGFYSGISAVLVGSTLSSAVYFGCIELSRSALIQYTSCTPLLVPPLSGAVGNIISSSILVPKEVITQRMQAGASGRSWNLLLRTVKNEGIRGLYSGYFAALIRNLPSSVLSFTAFEYIKALWLRNSGKRAMEPWQSVISGALAGAISGGLTTPLDVVKTRLMTQAKKEVMQITNGAQLQAQIYASSYKGIPSTLKQIWLEEGWLGMTRGMGPRVLHSALFSALGFCAFETVRVKLVEQHMAKLKLSETSPVIL